MTQLIKPPTHLDKNSGIGAKKLESTFVLCGVKLLTGCLVCFTDNTVKTLLYGVLVK